MQKIESKKERWHRIHAIKIHEREKSHPERLKRYKLGHSPKFRRSLVLHAQFDLGINYTETAQFFRTVYKIVFEEHRGLALDFSKCEAISPETCVVLAAEIDRCLRLRPGSVKETDELSASIQELAPEPLRC